MWIKEKEIQKIRCTQKISYTEACKQFSMISHFSLNKTFALVAKKKTFPTADCQTELTWSQKDKLQIVSNGEGVARLRKKVQKIRVKTY